MGDAITIRVRMGDTQSASVPTRAREDRAMQDHARKRGFLSWLARRGVRTLTGTASALGRAVGVDAIGSGLRAGRMLATPAGAIGSAVALGAIVALRLGTGRSFENMSENLKQMALGNLPVEALANQQARAFIASRPNLLETMGQEGGANEQIHTIFQDVRELARRDLAGRTMFMQDTRFQANAMLDNLILAGTKRAKESWDANGGPAALENLKQVLRKMPGGR